MIEGKVELEVRYAETDRMGFVYYGNYAQYLELGRVALLKEIGISYKSLEDRGYLLPVHSFSIRYLKAAEYDDPIEVLTQIKELPSNRIKFDYELRKDEDLIATAETTLIFMNPKGRACRPPQFFLDQLKPYFN